MKHIHGALVPSNTHEGVTTLPPPYSLSRLTLFCSQPSDLEDLLLLRAVVPFNSTVVASCVLPFKTRVSAARDKRGAVASRTVSGDTFLTLVAAVDAAGTLFVLDAERGEVCARRERHLLLLLPTPPHVTASSLCSPRCSWRCRRTPTRR